MSDSRRKDTERRADPWAAETLAGTSVAQERRRGILTVVTGGDIGRIVPIQAGQVVTMGRSEECTLQFSDAGLSRIHARVMAILDTFLVSDEGSTNGTFVNDVQVRRGTRLKDGDRLQLGASTVVRFSLVSEEEELALRRVYEAATLDSLTGVANRAHLSERLKSEVSFAKRHSAPLSVIMIDLDHFKRVNDTYGHLAGDEVLRHVARIVSSQLRAEDVVGRYGGEELLVIARATDLSQAAALAERLRSIVAASPAQFGGQPIAVTLSAGVASLDECGGRFEPDVLVSSADQRLYVAKRSGRNRVSSA